MALSSIGANDVSVTTSGTGPFTDTINFTGALANEFVNPISVLPTLGTASVAQTFLGGAAHLTAGILGVGTNGAPLMAGAAPTPLGPAPFIINNTGTTAVSLWADSSNQTISNPLEIVSAGTSSNHGGGRADHSAGWAPRFRQHVRPDLQLLGSRLAGKFVGRVIYCRANG